MAKTNKERLVCIELKIDSLLNGFENHLEHHKRIYDRLFKASMVILGAALAAATTVFVLIFKS